MHLFLFIFVVVVVVVVVVAVVVAVVVVVVAVVPSFPFSFDGLLERWTTSVVGNVGTPTVGAEGVGPVMRTISHAVVATTSKTLLLRRVTTPVLMVEALAAETLLDFGVLLIVYNPEKLIIHQQAVLK